VRFVLKDGNKPVTILLRFQNVVAERPMKQVQVYFWISEINRGHEDLSDEERARRPSDIGLDHVLDHRIELYPHTTVRKLAHSLDIRPQMVVNHLR
jgi:hypothetical protein